MFNRAIKTCEAVVVWLHTLITAASRGEAARDVFWLASWTIPSARCRSCCLPRNSNPDFSIVLPLALPFYRLSYRGSVREVMVNVSK